MAGYTVLLLGERTREHSLAIGFNESPHVDKIYWPTTNAAAYSLPKVVKGDYSRLKSVSDYLTLAKDKGVNFATTGWESLLFGGTSDIFNANGVPFFGPGRAGAELERQKAYAKLFMTEFGIPTAPFAIFADPERAKEYIRQTKGQKFVKLSGPGDGKGSFPGFTEQEALQAVDTAREFGDPAKLLVVEDRLYGREASVQALLNTRGEVMVVLPVAKDYKRVGEMYRTDAADGMVARGDVGGQTGSMGCYSPPSFFTQNVARRTHERILSPLMHGLLKRGIDYCGVVYPGLMIDDSENPTVIEINVRPGSKEWEVISDRVKNDMLELMLGTMNGTLRQQDLKIADDYTVGVALVSGPIDGHPGYPASGYKTGYPIEGINKVDTDVRVLLGGVSSPDHGKTLITSGGTVAVVVASGKTLREAKEKALRNAESIRYANKFYRDDICYEEGV